MASEINSKPVGTIGLGYFRNSTKSRVVVLSMNPQRDMGPHNHLFHEIAQVISGTAQHRTETGAGEIRAGDLVIIRPGEWHAYEQCHDFAVTNCLIHPDLMDDIGPLLAGIAGSEDLYRYDPQKPGPAFIVHADRLTRPHITSLLKAITLESLSARTGHHVTHMALILELFILIMRMREQPQKNRGVSEPLRIAVTLAAHKIQEHMTEAISLQSLAHAADVSPAHLSRMFTRQMGIGMVAYQHKLRAEEACRLLRLTPLSITEIAGRLGYAEVAYFSRRFKKEMGMSPAAFRNQQ